MSIRFELDTIAKEKILILDGAMGTMLQGTRSPDDDAVCCDLLCLTKPVLVRSVHEAYLHAGADIIETCSFSANAVSLADYGLAARTYDINRAAARLAKEAAEKFSTRHKPRFVAGVLGPTTKSASISPDMDDPARRGISWDELEKVYYENARGLLDGGADILLLETIFDTLNAKAAVFAVKKLLNKRGLDIPLMISGTVSDAAGRFLSGQTVEAFCVSLLHAKPWSFGLNCSLGAEKLKSHIRDLAAFVPTLVSCHPNAGMPNRFGEYDETPESMAHHIEEFMSEGLVNIVGGCCGTTPEHISALAALTEKYPPRRPPKFAGGADYPRTYFAGLEILALDNSGTTGFVDIGERTNVAGSKKFLRLIKEGAYNEALAIARTMIERGAAIIDICMDDPLLDAKETMTRFLKLAMADPEIARVPVMLDSSRWDVLEAALKCVQGKGLLNSISLKEGEAEFLGKSRLARLYGAAVVVMLFDERGQAAGYERKIEVARRSYDLLLADGFPPEDIVFDPNVLSVATGIAEHDRYALDFIRACAWIREHCPYARLSGGVSNLSFSFRGNDIVREAMHAVFLKHAADAGLGMAIVNPAGLVVYDDVEEELRRAAEDVILAKSPGAVESLLALALRIKEGGTEIHERGEKDGKKEKSWRDLDAEDRILYSLVKGIDEHIEKDVLEARPRYAKMLNMVEGVLMRGMKEVGDRFGEGKMFLPQVIRSAMVMKKAVAALEPFMAAEKNGTENGAGQPKILLATVKGDVHDIGKNIVSVVLGCNGYEVLDLGVMIPQEEILAAAERDGASIIGLSGLITPSLEEMARVAKEMEKRGLTIPLLIGGATTSLVHTALRIAPLYSGPVVYVSDASRSAETVRALLSDTERPRFLERLEQSYNEAALRHERIKAGRELLPVAGARKNRVAIDWESPSGGPAPAPKVRNLIHFDDYSVERIVPFIDWNDFCRAWDLPSNATERERLLLDARLLLEKVIKEKLILLKGVAGFFPAFSDGDDIVLFDPGSASGGEFPGGARRGESAAGPETGRFSLLRNQEKKRTGAANPCLADFVLPREAAFSGNSFRSDWVGLFTVSAVRNAVPAQEEKDDYNALLFSSLANHLAEAFAEELHLRVRREFWAYSPGEKISPGEALEGKYRGIRPCFGYPACPDHEDKRELFRLLEAEKRIGLSLTESAMIIPASSVAGMYLAHPAAYYFGLGETGEDQLADWAARKGIHQEEAGKRLGRV